MFNKTNSIIKLNLLILSYIIILVEFGSICKDN